MSDEQDNKKRPHTLEDHLLGMDAAHTHEDGEADHDHDHDDAGGEYDPTTTSLWRQDNITLLSVGIDIGSAGTQVIFSRVQLRRLAALGCKLLLVRGSTSVILQRCIQARADWWLSGDYAARFGRTQEEFHEYFLGEQDKFLEMAERSALESLIVTNDGSIDDVIDRVHEHWYSRVALRSFQRPMSRMSAEELRELQGFFEEPIQE